MKAIDFITRPPSDKITIFNQKRNKTKLGGAFFIIEIIAIILITFIYLFDHKNNLPYNIETNTIIDSGMGVYSHKEDLFDQKTNFTFNIYTDYGKSNELSNKFEIVDYSYEDYSNDKRKTGITKRPSELKLAIYYKCHNETVCKYMEKGNVDNDYTRKNYIFQINYPGFFIEHQGPEPIRNATGTISMKCPFLFDMITLSKLHWKNIKYDEDSGMWSRLFNKYLLHKEPKTYIKGYIDSYTTYPVEIEESRTYSYFNFSKYKLLSIIEIDIKKYDYLYYRRIPNSIFTTIANIAALISTVNFLLSSFLNFYSSNYENYIVIKYLSSPEKNLKENNLAKNSNKNLESNEFNDINEINGETDIPLINDENKIIDNAIGGEDIENNNDISFWSFFLNNLYFSCCKKKMNQEKIKLSNEIIEKYLSVENIIYNQIIMKNLLKDYKWNDPNLNNINKNEDIIRFNNLNEFNH